MGLGWFHLDPQVVAIRKLIVPMNGVAFLDLIGDFIIATRATENLHGIFDVFFFITIPYFQIALTNEPAAIPIAYIVDGDGLDEHRIFGQIICMRCMKCFVYRMACRSIHGLFDGQQLVMKIVSTFIAPVHQSIDGLGSETQHTESTNVGNDMDIA